MSVRFGADTSPRMISVVIPSLRNLSVSMSITCLKGTNINNYIIPKQLVLIIGNESKGISKKNLIEIDQMITIKKLGIGDSLNVATAASIIMHKIST